MVLRCQKKLRVKGNIALTITVAGPCEFEQRDLGTCPSPINKEQVYHDVPLLPMCVEYCTSFTDGNFECWGILFTATQEECHLIVT